MRIAHLTDLHLNGTSKRRARLRGALHRAHQGRAQHLILTGDLTAHGSLDNFQELSEELKGYEASSVTIVPGNHDGGTRRWLSALRNTGLGRFAATSTPGAMVDHGAVIVAAVDTTLEKRALAFTALGHIDERQLRRLDALGHATHKCIVLAMHHGHFWGPLFLFDGLTNREQLHSILDRHPHMHVCCGHHHRVLNAARFFGAGAVVDHPDPIRLYDVQGGRLVPVYQSSLRRGDYLAGWM